MSDSTVAFLERLHNRTTKGIEEEIRKRMTFSSSIINQLVLAIDKRVTRSTDISKMLAECSKMTGKTEAQDSSKDEVAAAAPEEEQKTEDEKKEDQEKAKKEQDEGKTFLWFVSQDIDLSRW